MPDSIQDRIKKLAREIWGEGEYTVHKNALEAVVRDASGTALYSAADLTPGGDHLGALERHLKRKVGGRG